MSAATTASNLAVAPSETTSFVSRIDASVRARVLWLGRELKSIYNSIAPVLLHIAKKICAFLPQILILQLCPLPLRFSLYLIALGTALVVLLAAKVTWVTAAVFQPFIFSVSIDFAHVTADVLLGNRFSGDLIQASYYALYAGMSALFGAYLSSD